MRRILFIRDEKAPFESVQLLQDMFYDALSDRFDLTVKSAGSVSKSEYNGLLKSHQAIVGTDMNLFKARKSFNLRVPVVLPSYGLGTRGLLQIWEWRELLQKGDAFICPSTADLASILVHIRDKQLNFCHLPYPVPDFYFQNKDSDISKAEIFSRFGIDHQSQSSWLMYSGRINQQKNIHLSLRVVKALVEMNHSVGLLIVGQEDRSGFPELGWDNTGYEEELKNLIEDLQIQDRVHFLGLVDRQTMHDLYHCVDLHLTLSTFRTEDFGFTSVEAMACGLPTVGTAWGGFWDTIKEGITGYRVPVHMTSMGFRVDWRAAVSRIIKILTNPDLRSYLEMSCKIYSRSQFTSRLFKDRFEEAIIRIIENQDNLDGSLDIQSMVDEPTLDFFQDLDTGHKGSGSLLDARKNLYANKKSKRVNDFFTEYSRSQPIVLSRDFQIYSPLPLRIEGNQTTILDRNWPGRITLQKSELEILNVISHNVKTLTDLAKSLNLTLDEVIGLIQPMFEKGLLIPLQDTQI
ncbi:MAG: hypothetical protein COU22_02010 [Candidatus Komeilibacteria bacterium CG10_big_fil_rev_8_21_14_0_10_41_13]|uniref:Glycosyl transferase family 1 domain-containing protein n=1 Tax=Candidatus Komeilibacteria bacterium CG10_big_fil_rev_8_21_14_0_10_41_13 TaxID=1974476 RepID=A0A2M6WCF1_9BACT|nr:MAG: hypothetical protein COU22_02010 [Candidatus Komeilibacteria bacterium CG10_big_fil_rev_8_21_14_0_10_41_13]